MPPSGMRPALACRSMPAVSASTPSRSLGVARRHCVRHPSGSDSRAPHGRGSAFRLYADERAAFERRFGVRETWQLAFAGSVRGLLPGARWDTRHPYWQVLDVQLQLDAERRTANIPVTIAIEPTAWCLRPATRVPATF